MPLISVSPMAKVTSVDDDIAADVTEFDAVTHNRQLEDFFHSLILTCTNGPFVLLKTVLRSTGALRTCCKYYQLY